MTAADKTTAPVTSNRTRSTKSIRSQPPAAPPLPIAAIDARLLGTVWPPVWWVGCHGGAGTSTLAKVTGLGVDAGAAWPAPEPTWPATQVVLVCRATATGAWAATGAVEQWRRRGAPADSRVLGVVAVAAGPRRPPRIVVERLHLLQGWVPTLWRIRWVETYLATDDPRDAGMPPDLAALGNAVGRAANIETGTP